MAKLRWSGKIISVQPRIRLLRSFDQRSHTYLGYGLVLDGAIGNEVRQFSIGVGKAAHQKHQFKVGDGVCGESLPVGVGAKSAPPSVTAGCKLNLESNTRHAG